MNAILFRRIVVPALVLGVSIALPSVGGADEVLDWNAVTFRAIGVAAAPGPLQGRLAAIVHVSMFDALNGTERRFTPIQPPGRDRQRRLLVFRPQVLLRVPVPVQAPHLLRVRRPDPRSARLRQVVGAGVHWRVDKETP